MSGLANILPGLREVRAALAAGYLWLLALWLIVGDRIPTSEEATGAFADLYRLSDAVSTVGAAVALSFLAYLVGTILGAENFSFLARWQLSTRAYVSIRRAVMPAAEDVQDRWQRSAPAQLADMFRDEDPFDPYEILQDSISELDVLATRLLVDEPPLYQAFDRARTEADVRLGIVLPLLVIVGALATESLWWLTAVAPIALLAAHGLRARQQAYGVLADAVLLGRVKPPALERAERLLDQIETRGRHSVDP